MRKWTSKGKHIVKTGNHPHANMIAKPTIMRRVKIRIALEIKRPAT